MPQAAAPAPTRATASIDLSWLMVNIPLSVYSATEDTGVDRSMFIKGDDGEYHPVGNALINKDADEPTIINRDDVVKMAKATSGALVVLNDDEVMKITHPDVRCEVVTFTPLDAIGTVYLPEKHYMVRPKRDKGKVNPTVEQGFALLLATMARRQVAALIKVAMRGPSRYAAILPTGRMVTLHYAEGVRESLPMPQVDLADNYLAMADQLIDAVGIDLPSLDDVNGAAVQAFVDAKAADGNVTPPTPDAPAPNPQALMDSLMASIEANKGKAKPKAAPRPRKAKAA